MAGETTTNAKVADTVMVREGLDLTAVFATHAVGTGELEAADVIQMVKIPKGATIQEVILSSTDIDVHGTPTVALSVGDASSATRFISSSAIGEAGGVARLDQLAGLNYEYTADDTIDIEVTTAAETAAAGTINLAVIYTMNQ
jgi:hypothetical protein